MYYIKQLIKTGTLVLLFSLLSAIFCDIAHCQESKTKSVSGKVVNSKTNQPLPGVAIVAEENNKWAVTDTSGYFEIKNIHTKTIKLAFSMLGMKKKTVTVKAGTKGLTVKLVEDNLKLQEVVVTGKESKAGESTHTKISAKALEHIQPLSLSDVIKLLPGQQNSNPDLSKPNQIVLRQVMKITSSGLQLSQEDAINAMGTSIIIDGAPISNNANLQTVSTTVTSTKNMAGAGMGVDLRQINPETVESMEVIRGIPSVQYGDLTSGAVIIETKNGYSPYQLKGRITPKTKQASITKGYKLDNKSTYLNVNVDYTDFVKNRTQVYKDYSRLSGQAILSFNIGKENPLVTKTSLSLSSTVDDNGSDPDDGEGVFEKSKDFGIRFNTKGSWYLDKSWLGKIQYAFSINYKKQDYHANKSVAPSGGSQGIATSLVDGTFECPIIPAFYVADYKIKGEPIDIFFKLSNKVNKNFAGMKHSIIMGGDWRTSYNRGKGKIFDPTRPITVSDNGSTRPRPYDDIPKLHQLSFYLEDVIKTKILNRKFTCQLGLRYDNYNPLKNDNDTKLSKWSPRVNMGYQLFRNFEIKGGYGIASKSVPLMYMYPDKIYLDNKSGQKVVSSSEYLFLMTTKVIEPNNENVKIAYITKKELGFSYRFLKRNNLSVTLFDEKTKHGYAFLKTPITFPVDQYTVNDDFTYTKTSTDNRITTYKTPGNDRIIHNKGIEFSLNIGQIKAIRTSFDFSGAYIKTKVSSENVYINNPMSKDTISGLYKNSGDDHRRAFNTTLRITHNIPEIRLVASLTVHSMWKYESYTDNISAYPYALITDRGQNSVTKQEIDDNYPLFVRNNTVVRYPQPRLTSMDFKLTKEIGEFGKISFYVNNFLNYRPYYTRTNATSLTRQNTEIYFGAEITYLF